MPTFYYADVDGKRHWFSAQGQAKGFKEQRAQSGAHDVEIEAVWVPRLSKHAVLDVLRHHSTPDHSPPGSGRASDQRTK
jgi:hypothetical protein